MNFQSVLTLVCLCFGARVACHGDLFCHMAVFCFIFPKCHVSLTVYNEGNEMYSEIKKLNVYTKMCLKLVKN